MSETEDTILAQLEALSDFIHDSEEYKGRVSDLRLYMNSKVYESLTEECGHPVHLVKGVRIEVTEEELDFEWEPEDEGA